MHDSETLKLQSCCYRNFLPTLATAIATKATIVSEGKAYRQNPAALCTTNFANRLLDQQGDHAVLQTALAKSDL